MFTSRRQLIRASAATLAFSGFSRFATAQEARPAAETYRSEISGYGPLRRDPAGVFDLPEGFSYTVISRAGDPMSDGLVTPGKMDGMGCFALDNDRVALVRNHEINPRNLEITAFGPGRALGGKIAADRIYRCV